MRHEQTYRQPNERWPRPKGRWLDSARLSRLLPAVLILMVALCCSSCATTKKTQTEQVQTVIVEKHDTVATVIKQTLKETVPGSQTQMKIAASDLLSLPPGATYQKKEGRATIRAEAINDTIYIAGVCDSLAREVEKYEELWRTSQNKLSALEAKKGQITAKTAYSPIKVFCIGLLLGIIVAVVGIIITIKRYKK